MDKARQETDKRLAEMEKHLAGIYERANKEVGEKWKAYMDKAAEKIKPFEQAVEAAKKSGDAEAIKKAEEVLAAKQKDITLLDAHYRDLTRKLSVELSQVNIRAAAYINDQLPDIYAINYNFTGNLIELETENAISFELVNERVIKNLVDAGDTSLLPSFKLDPKKDIPWNMQTINGEVLQGIIQGESMEKIADRIFPEIMAKTPTAGMTEKQKEGIIKRNEASAIRNARTIVTTVENKGRYDNAKAAAEKGVIIKKEWIATADKRTRDAHREAWGKYGTRQTAIALDEPFLVGGEEMMCAGDIAGGAANVYNCRCSTPYFPAGFTSMLPPEKRGKIKVRFVD